MSWRPEIPEGLERRIEDVYEQAGYKTKSELVRDAARQHVNDLEAKHHVTKQLKRDLFQYRIVEHEHKGPEIRLAPQQGSQLRFKYFDKGDPPHTTILDTGNTWVGQDDIEEAVQEVQGVDRCGVLTKGAISVDVAEYNDVPIEELVDDVYDALYELIEEADRRVAEGEQTREKALEDAVAPYWPHIRNKA